MQGFNMGRYVPPDVEGITSFNEASGKGHPLGARARRLKSEGILVVRFECPFAIWCTNCQPEQIIGQGVRFNAEKKKVGNYYSSPIWSFRIKHTVCGGFIEIRTDPKNTEYVVAAGGRRRDTGVDKLLDGEIRIGVSDQEKEGLRDEGGFGMLENKVEDKKIVDTQQKRIKELYDRSDRDWSDPYELNKKIRQTFRVGRRQRQADETSGEALQNKYGLGLDLLAPGADDATRAKLVNYGELEEASASTKPIFTMKESSGRRLQLSQTDLRKRENKIGTTGHKKALREKLKDKTLPSTDPFLKAEEKWQPIIKKRRMGGENTSSGTSHEITGTGMDSALVVYASESE